MPLIFTRRNPYATLDLMALGALFLLLVAFLGAGLGRPISTTLIPRFSERPTAVFKSPISSEYASEFRAYPDASGISSVVVNYH